MPNSFFLIVFHDVFDREEIVKSFFLLGFDDGNRSNISLLTFRIFHIFTFSEAESSKVQDIYGGYSLCSKAPDCDSGEASAGLASHPFCEDLFSHITC